MYILLTPSCCKRFNAKRKWWPWNLNKRLYSLQGLFPSESTCMNLILSLPFSSFSDNQIEIGWLSYIFSPPVFLGSFPISSFITEICVPYYPLNKSRDSLPSHVLPMWAYVHRDPMGSWQMASYCHTQMPTSYLSRCCQDKTHEAGMGSRS